MTDDNRSTDDSAISSPWVLIDDDTVGQAANVLDRLTTWLAGSDTRATARCAHALSLGETSDPITIANWTDALAARLRHRADDARIPTQE